MQLFLVIVNISLKTSLHNLKLEDPNRKTAWITGSVLKSGLWLNMCCMPASDVIFQKMADRIPTETDFVLFFVFYRHYRQPTDDGSADGSAPAVRHGRQRLLPAALGGPRSVTPHQDWLLGHSMSNRSRKASTHFDFAQIWHTPYP